MLVETARPRYLIHAGPHLMAKEFCSKLIYFHISLDYIIINTIHWIDYIISCEEYIHWINSIISSKSIHFFIFQWRGEKWNHYWRITILSYVLDYRKGSIFICKYKFASLLNTRPRFIVDLRYRISLSPWGVRCSLFFIIL